MNSQTVMSHHIYHFLYLDESFVQQLQYATACFFLFVFYK